VKSMNDGFVHAFAFFSHSSPCSSLSSHGQDVDLTASSLRFAIRKESSLALAPFPALHSSSRRSLLCGFVAVWACVVSGFLVVLSCIVSLYVNGAMVRSSHQVLERRRYQKKSKKIGSAETSAVFLPLDLSRRVSDGNDVHMTTQPL
jgi:hypothetical protein